VDRTAASVIARMLGWLGNAIDDIAKGLDSFCREWL
jgi:hypothetical protein